ncbi:hypothetical protein V6Z11_D09G094800 [Gossypium hirsutum]
MPITDVFPKQSLFYPPSLPEIDLHPLSPNINRSCQQSHVHRFSHVSLLELTIHQASDRDIWAVEIHAPPYSLCNEECDFIDPNDLAQWSRLLLASTQLFPWRARRACDVWVSFHGFNCKATPKGV